jgi:hypothetical protein
MIEDCCRRAVVISGIIERQSMIARNTLLGIRPWIHAGIELIQPICFMSYMQLVSITIESISRLVRIEGEAFA